MRDPFGTKTVDSLWLPTVDPITRNTLPGHLCPTNSGFDFVARSQGNIQNLVWRSQRLVFGHESDRVGEGPNRVVSRWYEVATNNWPIDAQAQPSLVQQGTLDGGWVFQPDDENPNRTPVHYTYPYLMPLASGDIALFTTRMYNAGYPELVWTAHRASDSAGQLGALRFVMQSGTAGMLEASTSWGEYEGIALDPTDGNRAWAVGQVNRCFPVACDSCSNGGQKVDWINTAAGSYTVPATPVRALTVARQTTPAPPDDPITVWIMPMDVSNVQTNITLTASSQSTARMYSGGTVVTLRALEDVTGFEFKHWKIDGLQVGGPPGQPPPRQINVPMLADHTAIPVYKVP